MSCEGISVSKFDIFGKLIDKPLPEIKEREKEWVNEFKSKVQSSLII